MLKTNDQHHITAETASQTISEEQYDTENLGDTSEAKGTFQRSPTRAKLSHRQVLWGWWPELISAFLALATLIVVAVLLRTYNHRSVTELALPSGLTLNGLIAIIATFCRTFLLVPLSSIILQELWLYYSGQRHATSSSGSNSRLSEIDVFDSASRGVMGCFTLLWHFRGKRYIASIAAFVAIISLSLSAFAQQLISFNTLVPSSPHSHLAPGNVAHSEAWTPSQSISVNGPDLGMVAAVHNGILSGNVAPLTAFCPSGNCTWPLTPSMAVCGACVPAKFERHCGPESCANSSSDSTCIKDKHCDYTLPSGAKARLGNLERWSLGKDTEPTIKAFEAIAAPAGHFNGSSFDRPYIANFDVIGAPYNNGVNVSFEVSAYECALWMCIQVYNTTTVSGKQQELVHSTIDQVDSSRQWAGNDWCPDTPEAELVSKDIELFTNIPSQITNATDAFVANCDALAVLGHYLSKTLNGAVSFNVESNIFSNSLIEGIWQGTTDLDTWISNIAMSMTNVIRSGKDKDSNSNVKEEYNGTAYEPGVSVCWVWIIPPAFCVLATLSLLAISIARTSRSRVAGLKASMLTMLLFDVDDEVKRIGTGTFSERSTVDRAVGETKVRLAEKEDGGWHFTTF